jgi:hypothetical protein
MERNKVIEFAQNKIEDNYSTSDKIVKTIDKTKEKGKDLKAGASKVGKALGISSGKYAEKRDLDKKHKKSAEELRAWRKERDNRIGKMKGMSGERYRAQSCV